jgi:hypothetical protein
MLFVAPGAASASGLGLGFSDGAFTGPQGTVWLQRAAAAGANSVRIDIGWVAPDTQTRPAGFDARNPADPHYNFSVADAAIKEAHALGLRVLVTFTGAPPWAEGRGRPAGVAAGTWRPSPAALEDYAIALGRRYSGNFPDPANPGHSLPRVYAFQVWNEPNLNLYLNPQWSGNTPASPSMYRAMLNAFYRGLKSVDPGALVVTAGTAPFGDVQAGGARVQPVLFWQGVLCAGSPRCPNPAHFDVLAHNMYSWGSPQTHAFWPDDVALPDLGKLTSLLATAERTGRALPRERHQVWITEVGYNSDPPNPYGVPLATDARWLDEALAELWREGATSIFWYLVGDEPPIPSYSLTEQSGVYYVNGEPKQSMLKAFQFPIDAWRAAGTTVDVWIRSPLGGRLKIQRYGRSGWETLRARQVRAGASFLTVVADGGGRSIRAQIGSDTSAAWRVG